MASNLGKVTRFTNLEGRSRKSEPLLGPFEDGYCNPRADDEPSNQELGIVPYAGWELAVAWLVMMVASAGLLAFGAWLLYQLVLLADWLVRS